ncbi:voltage-gated potassium channel [Violaceomyces palustris]|uniref:Voltage-gated potassium channel n=1 Tax=Violaceomyces palustris TaxID=1673888 RepID=A0ACD0P1E1_9BASI|nr:voltage-gated potassium channel [Violaceomyces palustris]
MGHKHQTVQWVKAHPQLSWFLYTAPLGAALVAPLATLLDIPALTQPWYSFNGQNLPDPPTSLILSAVGLGCNVLANALLILRFHPRAARFWEWTTIFSTIFWISKTAIAVANLTVFGILTRNGDGYAYNNGFWCAVVSVICAGIVSIMLILPAIIRSSKSETSFVKYQGLNFIASELSLIFVVAIQALVFSKVEGWDFFDGIYFSIVSMLTIGFGDFSPTKTSTKILLFPFMILLIALLSNQVSIIVGYFGQQKKKRRAKLRKGLREGFLKKHQKDKSRGSSADLEKEIERLEFLARREANILEMLDLVVSVAALIVFWMIGAMIYRFTEGWTFGDSLYFTYVAFLTIGYGDFSPLSSVGRVVFVVYALTAVPIVTSFVVQTICNVAFRIASLMAESEKERMEAFQRLDGSHQKRFMSHSEAVVAQTLHFFPPSGENERKDLEEDDEQEKEIEEEELEREIEEDIDEELDQIGDREEDGDGEVEKQEHKEVDDDVGGKEKSKEEKDRQREEEMVILSNAFKLACFLEAQARELLIENLPSDSKARLLLQADAEMQMRSSGLAGGEKYRKLCDLADFEIDHAIRTARERLSGKNSVKAGGDSGDAEGAGSKGMEEKRDLEKRSKGVGRGKDFDGQNGPTKGDFFRFYAEEEKRFKSDVGEEGGESYDDPDEDPIRKELVKALDTEEVLFRKVQRYRHTFASLLAHGSRLQGLKGEEKLKFERRSKMVGFDDVLEDNGVGGGVEERRERRKRREGKSRKRDGGERTSNGKSEGCAEKDDGTREGSAGGLNGSGSSTLHEEASKQEEEARTT